MARADTPRPQRAEKREDGRDFVLAQRGRIAQSDQWLQSELPRLISYANANAGVIFLDWDEGSSTLKMPFLAIGPGVKAGYTSTVSYGHSSIVKSIEAILGLPALPKVSSANALSDMFKVGSYP